MILSIIYLFLQTMHEINEFKTPNGPIMACASIQLPVMQTRGKTGEIAAISQVQRIQQAC